MSIEKRVRDSANPLRDFERPPRLPDGNYIIGDGHEPQPIDVTQTLNFSDTIKNIQLEWTAKPVELSAAELRAVLCDVLAAWAEGNAPQFGGKFVSMTNGLVRDLRERNVADLILVAQNYRETHGDKQ